MSWPPATPRPSPAPRSRWAAWATVTLDDTNSGAMADPFTYDSLEHRASSSRSSDRLLPPRRGPPRAGEPPANARTRVPCRCNPNPCRGRIDVPPTPTPILALDGITKTFPGRDRAVRGVAAAVSGPGHRAGRRERGRQIDRGEDPDRHLPADRGAHPRRRDRDAVSDAPRTRPTPGSPRSTRRRFCSTNCRWRRTSFSVTPRATVSG